MMRMSASVIGRSTLSLSTQVAFGAEDLLDDVANALGLLGRAVLISLGRHGDVPKASPGETARRANRLCLKPGRDGASGIEELGGEGANVGMQPPGLGEKQAAIGRNRLLAVKNVMQRRHVRAFGVAALHRLFELLRIAEQHDAARRLRHRQDVGERHLRGLVDEEHVDRVRSVRRAPRAMPSRRPRCSPSPIASSSASLFLTKRRRGWSRSASLLPGF